MSYSSLRAKRVAEGAAVAMQAVQLVVECRTLWLALLFHTVLLLGVGQSVALSMTGDEASASSVVVVAVAAVEIVVLEHHHHLQRSPPVPARAKRKALRQIVISVQTA